VAFLAAILRGYCLETYKVRQARVVLVYSLVICASAAIGSVSSALSGIPQYI